MVSLFAERALLPEGWANRVRLTLAGDGTLAHLRVAVDPQAGDRRVGTLIPAMANLHSHAFQRAMAGLAEFSQGGRPNFWTWRETMYGFVRRLTPEDVYTIACQLYSEMLAAGYGSVAEFHYVHGDPDGKPYAIAEEMSLALVAAAEKTGIGLTLLPVLYQASGFGGKPLGEGQARFGMAVDRFCRLLEDLDRRLASTAHLRLGLAFHSLRAVAPEALTGVLAAWRSLSSDGPIHLHIAEQVAEVDDCLAWSGQRPVAWLLEKHQVDARWCLVHATHMDEGETRALARSGAVAGLCPTTEANLGDGFFPLERFLAEGGRLGIGSDSHISVNPIEELRWLEYGQRLLQRCRNIASSSEEAHTGARLWRLACAGGAQALGLKVGQIAEGYRADVLEIDDDHPLTYGRSSDGLLDALVFAGNRSLIKAAMYGGKWLVEQGDHIDHGETAAAYKQVVMRHGAGGGAA